MARGKSKVIPVITLALMAYAVWTVYSLGNRVSNLETKSPVGSVRTHTIDTRDQTRESLLVEMNAHLNDANNYLENGNQVKAKYEIEKSLELMGKVAPKDDKKTAVIGGKLAKTSGNIMSTLQDTFKRLISGGKSPAPPPAAPEGKPSESKGG